MKNPYFGRLLTAMVTPFNADGTVNYDNAADLAEWLIAHGSNGLVVAGSTGEAATMTVDEKLELFRVVVNRVNKRVPVIAGTGCNCTAAYDQTLFIIELYHEWKIRHLLSPLIRDLSPVHPERLSTGTKATSRISRQASP